MATNPLPYVSPEEYLELERKAEFRSEYYQGQLYAMAGGSPNHARLIRNAGSLLQSRLRGTGCEAFPTDLRVRVPGAAAYLYPDLSIICGKLLLDDLQCVTNPIALIEVLSPSTEGRDRGQKFALYRKL